MSVASNSHEFGMPEPSQGLDHCLHTNKFVRWKLIDIHFLWTKMDKLLVITVNGTTQVQFRLEWEAEHENKVIPVGVMKDNDKGQDQITEPKLEQ